MAHGDAQEGNWRWIWQMEWGASTLHTTSEHGVSSITTADAHISSASSRLNWHPCWFKWTRPFRRKTKSGFCACAITFQTQSTQYLLSISHYQFPKPTVIFRQYHQTKYQKITIQCNVCSVLTQTGCIKNVVKRLCDSCKPVCHYPVQLILVPIHCYHRNTSWQNTPVGETEVTDRACQDH